MTATDAWPHWTCPPPCGAVNLATLSMCEVCGADAPTETGPCPIDGTPLAPMTGRCSVGQGWAMTRAKQPFVCPDCRQPLEWSGKCYRCMTMPGDRYEVIAGHWRKVGGPEPPLTSAQKERAAQIQQSVLDRVLTAEEGHALLDQALTPKED